MSMVTSTPDGMTSSRGSACGSAEWGPDATIEGKEGASAPRRRISCSISIATSRSLRPARPRSASHPNTSSISAAATRMRSISGGAL